MRSHAEQPEDVLAPLFKRLGKTRREIEGLIAAGEWQVWTAYVSQPVIDGEGWHWQFRNDFPVAIAKWLDIERPEGATLADALNRARVSADWRRCHANSQRALNSAADGYDQTFRIRTRDESIVWVHEQVVMEPVPGGSYYMIGVGLPASPELVAQTQALIDSADSATADRQMVEERSIDGMDAAELRKFIEKLRVNSSLLARSGKWLIWSAMVRLMKKDPPEFHWSFRSDFTQVLPPWFDVERIFDEDLAMTLGLARFPEDDRVCSENATRALLSGSTGYSQTFRVKLRDNRLSWVDENVAIERIDDGIWHLVGVCIDATERKAAEELLVTQNEELQNMQSELEAQNEELQTLREVLEAEKQALARANAKLAELATTDGLTGVKNHRAFREQLDVELSAAERYRTPLSLVLLDVDHFKALNDKLGHTAGDSALAQIGNLLRENARDCDFVARYGGEEFVIILPSTDLTGARTLAERFRSKIETTIEAGRRVTASFGIASVDVDGASDSYGAESLINRADKALYAAKAAGRNCVVVAPSIE